MPKAKQIGKRIGDILEGRADEPEDQTLAPEADELEQMEELERQDAAVLHCPGCDAPYRLGDYRRDAPVILCTVCDTELPRHFAKESEPEAVAVS